MEVLFYAAGVVAVAASLLAVTRANAIHALLYLVVSLLAAALVFAALGAPFAAALEVIVYAGAIMVLFVFVLMMLDLRRPAIEREASWLGSRVWVGPAVLAVVLLAQLVWALPPAARDGVARRVGPEEVGSALFGPYLVGVELAGFLLLAALVGAFHLGRRDRTARGASSRPLSRDSEPGHGSAGP